MSIRRSRLHFERDFVQIPNSWMRDRKLSRKARGLLGEIMTHSVDWVITIDALIDNGPEGREAVQTGIRELVAAGYLERVRIREAGRLAGSTYILADPEHPFDSERAEIALSAAGAERAVSRASENHPPKKTNLQEHEEDPPTPQRQEQPRLVAVDGEGGLIDAIQTRLGVTFLPAERRKIAARIAKVDPERRTTLFAAVTLDPPADIHEPLGFVIGRISAWTSGRPRTTGASSTPSAGGAGSGIKEW